MYLLKYVKFSRVMLKKCDINSKISFIKNVKHARNNKNKIYNAFRIFRLLCYYLF